MSHQISLGKTIKWLLPLSLIVTVTDVLPVSGHKVQTAADVGGTLHVEPNDSPQAGKRALTWIALTRKGGQTIPLEQCNCQLAVYAEPDKGSQPILKPPLKPISAEGYKGVPGAEIVFPQAGAYQLQLSGTPKAGASFKPFQLNYPVTVASGVAAPSPQPADKSVKQQLSQSGREWQINVITVSIVLGLGILWLLLRRLQVKNR